MLPGCGAPIPAIRYYELNLQTTSAPAKPADANLPVLAVEPFAVDTAYDDNRIVYRESSVRLDYYHYHRWSAPPGTLVADEMRAAYARTGLFTDVVEGVTKEVSAVLSGRVLALEEVDTTRTKWKGRLRLSLQLRDAKSGELLWSQTVEEEEPMRAATQEALALALSQALLRVVQSTAPTFASLARRASQ
jgi:ABC-type uncharacterized transport system auxiliary subunit